MIKIDKQFVIIFSAVMAVGMIIELLTQRDSKIIVEHHVIMPESVL